MLFTPSDRNYTVACVVLWDMWSNIDSGPDNCLINIFFANTKFKSKVILDILNCFQAYIYDTFISVENKLKSILHQISNFTASSWRVVICVSYQSNNSILNMFLMKGTGFIKIILAKINGIPCSPSHKTEQYGKIFDCIFKIPPSSFILRKEL